MAIEKSFDVIVVGGSYSGLSAAMALGRALKRVLVIDSGKPCNRQTPHSHNFVTQDGKTPAEISALAREQVSKYDTIQFSNGEAVKGQNTARGFEIQTAAGETFGAGKVIFASGIKDIIPNLPGFAECWGISLIHCPYCHGYEVRNQRTGLMANGNDGFEFAQLLSNWTPDLTFFTNGRSLLTGEQTAKLAEHRISIVEKAVLGLDHKNGLIENILFDDGTTFSLKALYARIPFVQSSSIPDSLGCEVTDGYLKTDGFQRTTVPGVFACGDNSARMRTLAVAVATGTVAGMTASKEIVLEQF